MSEDATRSALIEALGKQSWPGLNRAGYDSGIARVYAEAVADAIGARVRALVAESRRGYYVVDDAESRARVRERFGMAPEAGATTDMDGPDVWCNVYQDGTGTCWRSEEEARADAERSHREGAGGERTVHYVPAVRWQRASEMAARLAEERDLSEASNREERDVWSKAAALLGLARYGGAYRVTAIVPAVEKVLAERDELREALDTVRRVDAMAAAIEERDRLRADVDKAYAALDAAFPEFKFAGVHNGIAQLAEQRDEARAAADRLAPLRLAVAEMRPFVSGERGAGTSELREMLGVVHRLLERT